MTDLRHGCDFRCRALLRGIGYASLWVASCLIAFGQPKRDWEEVSAELCACMERDDLDAFRQAVIDLNVDILTDFFDIRCPPSAEFAGGDLFRTAAVTGSNTVGRHVVLFLDQEVGRERLAEYLNAIDPVDGLTLLDWMTLQADALHGLDGEARDTRRRYVLMVQNFRRLGAKFSCEIIPDMPCRETPEAWLERQADPPDE